jgi:hypothetical protein
VRRAGRRVRAQWPFLLAFAVLLVAVAYLALAPGHWRRGSSILALGVLLAGLLRLVLPSPRAGLLEVRARWFDVFCYGVLGVAILVAAIQLQ